MTEHEALLAAERHYLPWLFRITVGLYFVVLFAGLIGWIR